MNAVPDLDAAREYWATLASNNPLNASSLVYGLCNDLEDARAALQAVLDLHGRYRDGQGNYRDFCLECFDRVRDGRRAKSGDCHWPCPTVRAVTAALNAETVRG